MPTATQRPTDQGITTNTALGFLVGWSGGQSQSLVLQVVMESLMLHTITGTLLRIQFPTPSSSNSRQGNRSW